MKKVFLNWSSGKDAALSLFLLQKDNTLNVAQLVTTLSSKYNRVSMHGLREELLDQQIAQLKIPLQKLYLPESVSMKDYNAMMDTLFLDLAKEGFDYAAYGDIFLEDLKKYREETLKKSGLKALFPLWKKDTKTIMEQYLALGFKAITVSVNAKLLDASFVGRIVDKQFLEDLPENIDVCGENGEFHTFVFDGPIFKNPINFKIGEKVLRSYSPSKNDEDDCFKTDKTSWDTEFWYCDLLPK